MIALEKSVLSGREPQYSGTVGYEQEVQRFCHHNKLRCSRAVGICRRPAEIELTSARNIHMAAWLVCSGIQRKVEHKATLILWGNNIRTTECIRHVSAEELLRKGIKDLNTMRRERQSAKCLKGLSIAILLNTKPSCMKVSKLLLKLEPRLFSCRS